MLEPPIGSVQDAEGIGNGKPLRSEEVHAPGSEGAMRALAQCWRAMTVVLRGMNMTHPSHAMKLLMGWQFAFSRMVLDLGTEEPTEDESGGSDRVEDPCMGETESRQEPDI